MKFFKGTFFLVLLIIVGLGGIFYLSLLFIDHFYARSNSNVVYGVSFSPEYARYLELDSRKVFTTILDEWKFRYLRFSAQWDSVEPTAGKFDFSELDWLMNEAAHRQAKVILTIGQKTPRWPECHLPKWAQELSVADYRTALPRYLATVVERYKNHPALEVWQVENEPFLPFGITCPNFNSELLSQELTLVKQLDPHHSTLVTDSGELSTWRKTAQAADLFGTTMYRIVWNKYIGYWSYNWIPAQFYRLKLWLTGRNPLQAYVVELQGEPWLPDKHITEIPLAEQYKSMNAQQLEKNVAYARMVGLPRAYLWGAEWWYWLRERGEPALSNFITTLNITQAH